jgi:pantoate--beta-alanine ligase
VSSPQLVTFGEELRRLVDSWKAAGQTVALVPTMGALHDGHRALVARAGQVANRVVVSIFVNPLQFGEGEDFDRYPRGLDGDLAALGDLRVDLVFAPQVVDVYPDWPHTHPTRVAGVVGEKYEGADRPGHFDGVLTVVDRLFDLVGCDVAVFGQKDAQQVFLVSQMAATRTPPVVIDQVATVRDEEGLALSSRNSYLSMEAMARAAAIPEGLHRIVQHLQQTPRADQSPEGVESAIADTRDFLTGPGFDCHYVDIVDAHTFDPWRGEPTDQVTVMVACSVDGVRLLDAATVTLPAAAEH